MIDLILANSTLVAVLMVGAIWATWEGVSAMNARQAHPVRVPARRRGHR